MNALLFDKTKKASLRLSSLSDKARNAVLLRLADAIVAEADTLLAANAEDLQNREPSDPLYDRLQLTKERLEGIAADMRKVVSLPDPLGRVLVDRVLPNGLQLRKVSVRGNRGNLRIPAERYLRCVFPLFQERECLPVERGP